jgi:hypothetical protein
MNMFQELITTCRVVLPPLERYVRQLSPALQVIRQLIMLKISVADLDPYVLGPRIRIH